MTRALETRKAVAESIQITQDKCAKVDFIPKAFWGRPKEKEITVAKRGNPKKVTLAEMFNKAGILC